MNNFKPNFAYRVFDEINKLFGQLDDTEKMSVLCMLIDDVTINGDISAKELFDDYLLPAITEVNDEFGDFGINSRR